MPHSTPLITTIAAAFGLALLLGFAATRLRVPALVGYLLAGILIGPFTPGFVADGAVAAELAEIGVMLGISERTVRRDWRKARAFLLAEQQA